MTWLHVCSLPGLHGLIAASASALLRTCTTLPTTTIELSNSSGRVPAGASSVGPYAGLGSIAGRPRHSSRRSRGRSRDERTTADPNSIARNAISRQDATVPDRETR
jgi:hypothetical protein